MSLMSARNPIVVCLYVCFLYAVFCITSLSLRERRRRAFVVLAQHGAGFFLKGWLVVLEVLKPV